MIPEAFLLAVLVAAVGLEPTTFSTGSGQALRVFVTRFLEVLLTVNQRQKLRNAEARLSDQPPQSPSLKFAMVWY